MVSTNSGSMIVLNGKEQVDNNHTTMKYIIALFMMVPLIGTAQDSCRATVGAGYSIGYSPAKQSPLFELYIAAKLTNNIILYPVSFKVHTKMNNPSVPVIIEPRIGYKFGGTEIYGGYGYHFAGQDGKTEYRKYRGFRPGAGIIQHFGRIFIATLAVSGEVYTGTIGVFAFR